MVATCGGEEKALLLKKLGVDRVIDYKAEDIKTVRLFDLGFSLFYLLALFPVVLVALEALSQCTWAFYFGSAKFISWEFVCIYESIDGVDII